LEEYLSKTEIFGASCAWNEFLVVKSIVHVFPASSPSEHLNGILNEFGVESPS
jgi:hypothetical protein